MLRCSVLALSLSLLAPLAHAAGATSTTAAVASTTASANAAANKAIVKAFYEMAFVDHKAKEAAEQYLAESYIQHNPHVPTGRQPFIDYFVPFFAKNKDANSEIKRLIAEDDLVVVHVLSKGSKTDRGTAIVDIFRVSGGKITEHWDVGQPVAEKSANTNTMF